jgi:hypothetical protein
MAPKRKRKPAPKAGRSNKSNTKISRNAKKRQKHIVNSLDESDSSPSDAENEENINNNVVVSDGSTGTPSPTKKGKVAGPDVDQEKPMKALGLMLEYKMNDIGPINFETNLCVDLTLHPRTKTIISVWKYMKEDGLIVEEKSSSSKNRWVISDKGVDLAKTPEYEEYLKDKMFQPKTTEEHFSHMKRKILGMKKKSSGMTKSERNLGKTEILIYYKLKEYGPLNKKVLAGLLGVKQGTWGFFYAIKELQRLKYIEQDPSDKTKIRLSDRAFMRPEDRPEPKDLDLKTLEEAIKYATTRNRDDPTLSKPTEASSCEKDQAYETFAKSNIARIKEENPYVKRGEITRILKDRWRDISDEVQNENHEADKGGCKDPNKQHEETDKVDCEDPEEQKEEWNKYFETDKCDCEDPNEQEKGGCANAEDDYADNETEGGHVELETIMFNTEEGHVANDPSCDLNPRTTEEVADSDHGEVLSMNRKTKQNHTTDHIDSNPLKEAKYEVDSPSDSSDDEPGLVKEPTWKRFLQDR